jgi:hypothetical protein
MQSREPSGTGESRGERGYGERGCEASADRKRESCDCDNDQTVMPNWICRIC